MIRTVRYGRLRVILPSGAVVEKAGSEPGPDAMIIIRRWRLLRRLIVAGDVGFAEGFLNEEWTTPDLTALIRLAAQNRDALAPAIDGSLLMRVINRAGHLLNANTRKGSRRNIEAHYDLGNDFYKEWLDSSMLYSSAIFDETTATLEAAQRQKLERIRQKLALTGGERVLEIGCGWGALALHLATQSDADVTGITLSPPSSIGRRKSSARPASRGGWICVCRIIEISAASSTGSSRSRCLKPWGSLLAELLRDLKT